MLRALYRHDREKPPPTRLTFVRISPPTDGATGRRIPLTTSRCSLPYRSMPSPVVALADGLYDLVISARLQCYTRGARPRQRHLPASSHRPNFNPTEGSIALGRKDLLAVIAEADVVSFQVLVER